MPPSAAIVTDRGDFARDPYVQGMTAGPTAVSWGAVFAGAAAASTLSFILLILGTGLGLSSVSPWANEGASGKALGIGTFAWVLFMQLAASALGGYIAGRLRTKWVSLHNEEVAFRDTAHGFLAWGVATLFTAWLVAATTTAVVSSGVHAGAQVAGGAVTAGAADGAAKAGSEASKSNGDGGPMGYMVDSLFRGPNSPKVSSSGEEATGEVMRIFTNAVTTGKLPAEDARYAAQVVAQRTGVSQQEAEKRVNQTFADIQKKKEETEAKARQGADAARKATATAALALFIALLVGALIASFTATIGGRQRDD
jgi:hypothetical protein